MTTCGSNRASSTGAITGADGPAPPPARSSAPHRGRMRVTQMRRGRSGALTCDAIQRTDGPSRGHQAPAAAVRRLRLCYATTQSPGGGEGRGGAQRRAAGAGQQPISSNSARLAEVGRRAGARAYLIDDADGLDMGWLVAARSVAVTSGASAPEVLVQGVIDRLAQSSMRRASWSVTSCRGCWSAECVWIGIEAGPGSAGANWLRQRAKYGFLRSSVPSQIAVRTAISRR